jgi:hypothetical protein
VNDSLKRTWKEAVVAFSKYCRGICAEGLTRATRNVGIFSVPTEIVTQPFIPLEQPARCSEISDLVRDGNFLTQLIKDSVPGRVRSKYSHSLVKQKC